MPAESIEAAKSALARFCALPAGSREVQCPAFPLALPYPTAPNSPLTPSGILRILPPMNDLPAYCLEFAQRAKAAAADLAQAGGDKSNAVCGPPQGCLASVSRPWPRPTGSTWRLRQAPGSARPRSTACGWDPRIAAMQAALEQVAALPEPIGEVISSSIRPNGLEVQKIGVPLGVIFIMYESRPDVTVDAAAICVKSGNAVILRGGKEAAHSNTALAEILPRLPS